MKNLAIVLLTMFLVAACAVDRPTASQDEAALSATSPAPALIGAHAPSTIEERQLAADSASLIGVSAGAGGATTNDASSCNGSRPDGAPICCTVIDIGCQRGMCCCNADDGCECSQWWNPACDGNPFETP